LLMIEPAGGLAEGWHRRLYLLGALIAIRRGACV
jgi:hypothetical protein